MKLPVLLALTLSLFCLGCERAAELDETKVELYTQFATGDDYLRVLAELDLLDKEVRYRSGLPANEMAAVYFIESGNVHLDARNVKGQLVLRSTPFCEPVIEPVAERLAEWDTAADAQKVSKSAK